ncbi:hypothetical protein NQP46_32805 [Streptomyces albus]|nr:hypothetical protein NQP46_32805 [Streptomyces albus]
MPRYPASLTTTVPKEFVHRSGVAEVMLTRWERVDDTHFTLSAQLPRLKTASSRPSRAATTRFSSPRRSARRASCWPTPSSASPSATSS